MSTTGRGRVVRRPALSVSRSISSGAAKFAYSGVRKFVKQVGNCSRKISNYVDKEIEKNTNLQKAQLDNISSETEKILSEIQEGLLADLENLKLKRAQRQSEIEELYSEHEKIEEDFLNNFEIVDCRSEKKYGQKIKNIYIELDQKFKEYNQTHIELDTEETKKSILLEKIKAKVDEISKSDDSDIISQLQSIKDSRDNLQKYASLVDLEIRMQLQQTNNTYREFLKVKSMLLDNLTNPIFLSEKYREDIFNKITQLDSRIDNVQYENGLADAKELLKEIDGRLNRVEKPEYLEMLTSYNSIHKRISEIQIDDDIIKNVLSKLGYFIDIFDKEKFEGLYKNIDEKIKMETLKLISDSIKTIYEKHNYKNIKISDKSGKETLIGFKDNKPLSFWIESNGEFEFDFSEDALESDQQCHAHMKSFLIDLKKELKTKGLFLDLFELTKKFRVQNAINEAIEEITGSKPVKIKKDKNSEYLHKNRLRNRHNNRSHE